MALEFIRDDDGTPLAYAEAKALELAGTCPPVRELRLLANGKLLWSLDVDNVDGAYARLRRDMQNQAALRGVTDFNRMVAALKAALGWSADEARALALVFVFPAFLAFDRVSVSWNLARGRGRPFRVDARTKHIWSLACAWESLTGTVASAAPNSLFAKALVAVIPFFHRSGVGATAPIGMSRLLARERGKVRSQHFRWLPPMDSGVGFQRTN